MRNAKCHPHRNRRDFRNLQQARESETMELDKVLAELLKERNLIDEAIALLEPLSTRTHGVRSRPQRRVLPDEPQKEAGIAACD
jgi:hypothetical protein